VRIEDLVTDNKNIRLVPLFSGSSGNSTLLECEGTRILIDIGRTCKQISEALYAVGSEPTALDAIFITHDHSDHISGVDVFIRKYGIPVYATEGTWRGMHAVERKPHDITLDHVMEEGSEVTIGDVCVRSFATPHDAYGSCGYKFTSASGMSVAIATDLGTVTEEIYNTLLGSTAVLLEANYDYHMLWEGPYPYPLKKRVNSNHGHLCNDDCARTIYSLYQNGTRHFILGHLSQENNHPMVAERTIQMVMSEAHLTRDEDYTLTIAKRHTPTEPLLLPFSKVTK